MQSADVECVSSTELHDLAYFHPFLGGVYPPVKLSGAERFHSMEEPFYRVQFHCTQRMKTTQALAIDTSITVTWYFRMEILEQYFTSVSGGPLRF